MWCDKTSDNCINHLQKRALRTVYIDNISKFEKLLEEGNSVTNQIRNLRMLATGLFRTKENLAAPIIHEIFQQKNIQYNLHSQTDFQLGSVKTVNCSLKALRYLRPKIWNIVPLDIKNSETLEEFKMKIKSWNHAHCPCNLYQPYFHCIGYI